MVQNIKKLSDFLNIEFQKDSFDKEVSDVLSVIKKVTNLKLEPENIFIKNGVVKVKTTSNSRFVVLLHLELINIGLKGLGSRLNLEL